ncbi:MAG: hypothetical protein WDN26_05345 [Chitinophagaceae bacterium]
MSKPDQWVITTIVLLILLHLSILAIGYFTAKFTYLAAFLNIAFGASVILYWVVRQTQIKQHHIEGREIIVLLAEVLVIATAVFYLATHQKSNGIKIMQGVFFGIHLAVLILALVFMLTFKMNRLI